MDQEDLRSYKVTKHKKNPRVVFDEMCGETIWDLTGTEIVPHKNACDTRYMETQNLQNKSRK